MHPIVFASTIGQRTFRKLVCTRAFVSATCWRSRQRKAKSSARAGIDTYTRQFCYRFPPGAAIHRRSHWVCWCDMSRGYLTFESTNPSTCGGVLMGELSSISNHQCRCARVECMLSASAGPEWGSGSGVLTRKGSRTLPAFPRCSYGVQLRHAAELLTAPGSAGGRRRSRCRTTSTVDNTTKRGTPDEDYDTAIRYTQLYVSSVVLEGFVCWNRYT